MKKFSIIFAFGALVVALPTISNAQNVTFDDVHLFQSFFRDAPIAQTPYGDASFTYSNFDFFDRTMAAVQAGYALNDKIEIGSGVYYVTRMPDEVNSESAIADVPVFGRYNFITGGTKLSGGVTATIPVGSEEIGEGNLNFGAFGAVRHPLSEYVVLTGTLGVDFLDTAIEDYEASLNLGGGIIYQARENLHVVGELNIQSDLDYSAVSAGVDYQPFNFARLRANLLLGTDETAPDFGLSGGFLILL